MLHSGAKTFIFTRCNTIICPQRKPLPMEVLHISLICLGLLTGREACTWNMCKESSKEPCLRAGGSGCTSEEKQLRGWSIPERCGTITPSCTQPTEEDWKGGKARRWNLAQMNGTFWMPLSCCTSRNDFSIISGVPRSMPEHFAQETAKQSQSSCQWAGAEYLDR